MDESVEPPLGITPEAPPRLRAGVLVGSASCVAGVVLAIFWLLIRFVPAVRAAIPSPLPGGPYLPFFDGLRAWHGLNVGVTQLAIAAVLVLIGWGLLTRRRWAPLGFLLAGWGGLVFTVFAFWPGRSLRAMVGLAMAGARKQGAIGPDEGFLDLVPAAAKAGVVVFVVVWLVLLVVGTVHVVRNRHAYTR
jgi:hypothetical protein